MAWFQDEEKRIYYEDKGQGTPVLLLPGWGGNVGELGPLATTLRAQYRVIAADLPGSGQSEPQPREYTPDYLERDAASLIRLAEELGVATAHVVGFSDGGEIALLLAEMAPDKTRSVVTWGAAGKLVAPPEMLEAFYNVVDDPIPPLEGLSQYLSATYGAANARAMTRSVATALKTIIEAGGDISLSRAGQIRCPVLLMTGEYDFFAPPTLVSETAARISRATFLQADGAEHDVHNSKGDWLASTIVEWLSRN